MHSSTIDTKKMWRLFLIELMFAKSYTVGYFPVIPKNLIVERLLPALLHIKATAILDYALRGWIHEKGFKLPKAYRADLNGRIKYLSDQNILRPEAATPLDAIRSLRNALAHEAQHTIDWDKLDQDVHAIHGALQHLSMVGDFPHWEMHAERSALLAGEIPGAIHSRHYVVSIKDGHRVVAEYTWPEHLMRDHAT